MPTSTPKRIQRKRSKGWRKPAGAVDITRPGRWGNPHNWKDLVVPPAVIAREIMVDTVKAREISVRNAKKASVSLFETGLTDDDRATIKAELAGKDLMCWCNADDHCHGDVLLRIANS